jgi:hypothetical protein
MLHKAERRTVINRTARETEAEAIAFVVGKTIGLSMGRASADYIHLYHGDASLVAESLEVIQRASALILAAIETHQQRRTQPTSKRKPNTKTRSCKPAKPPAPGRAASSRPPKRNQYNQNRSRRAAMNT